MLYVFTRGECSMLATDPFARQPNAPDFTKEQLSITITTGAYVAIADRASSPPDLEFFRGLDTNTDKTSSNWGLYAVLMTPTHRAGNTK